MEEWLPDELIRAGGDVDLIRVSIRVGGDDLDPDEVTRALGVAPDFAARKGERRQSGGSVVTQPTGVWSVGISGREWTLEDAIAALLDRLSADLAVWDALAGRYRMDAFCGLRVATWNRGAVLSSELLRRLADRHLDLSLDIYYAGDG